MIYLRMEARDVFGGEERYRERADESAGAAEGSREEEEKKNYV